MGGDQAGTIGVLSLSPNLVNVVAESALMTVDLRNPDEVALKAAETRLSALIAEVTGQEGVTVKRRTLALFEPVDFHPRLVALIENAALALKLSTRRMFSGAGHDAQMIARLAPSAMIFVPSVGGISHNVTEYTDPADLANGANVLLQVVLKRALPTNEGVEA